MQSDQIKPGTLYDGGDLLSSLTAGMPDRFFEVFNALMKQYPELSFETATMVAWEVVSKDKHEFYREHPDRETLCYECGCAREHPNHFPSRA